MNLRMNFDEMASSMCAIDLNDQRDIKGGCAECGVYDAYHLDDVTVEGEEWGYFDEFDYGVQNAIPNLSGEQMSDAEWSFGNGIGEMLDGWPANGGY